MAGLDIGTVVLLVAWTAWLLAALLLLGYDRRNVLILLVFVTLGVTLEIWAHFPWRGYLMMWLGIHLLIASLISDSDDRRQYPLALVSLGGVFWLWGQGGWPYAREVLTGVVIAAIAAVLVAAGFVACWHYVAGPLRDRADRLGAQASQLPAERTRAARAERSAAQAESLLARERRERQQAHTASLRRIEQLQNRLRDEETKRDAADGDVMDGDGMDGMVTLARTTVSWIPAEQTRGAASKGLYDLVVTRAEATVPRDCLPEAVTAETQRTSRDDPGEPGKFIDATAAYLGGRIGNDVFDAAVGRTWMTRDPLDIDAVAQGISDSDTWLHDIVSLPMEGVAHGLDLNDAASSLAEGIGSDFVLAPVDAEFGEAVRVLEIVGVVAGAALGLHPLAIACTKSLTHSWLNGQITSAVKDALRDRTPSIAEIEPECRLNRAPAELEHSATGDVAEIEAMPELDTEVPGIDDEIGGLGSLW